MVLDTEFDREIEFQFLVSVSDSFACIKKICNIILVTFIENFLTYYKRACIGGQGRKYTKAIIYSYVFLIDN